MKAVLFGLVAVLLWGGLIWALEATAGTDVSRQVEAR